MKSPFRQPSESEGNYIDDYTFSLDFRRVVSYYKKYEEHRASIQNDGPNKHLGQGECKRQLFRHAGDEIRQMALPAGDDPVRCAAPPDGPRRSLAVGNGGRAVILTNGAETFAMAETVDDAQETTIRAKDLRGNWYALCVTPTCDHSQVPDGALVWHDVENTETLWEVR
jgi:hypothetical protein